MSKVEKVRGLPVMFWNMLKNTTNDKLNKHNIHNIEFKNPPKNDRTYLKAKGNTPYTNWAYAVKLSEIWIEFEIKPINKEKQHNAYEQLISNRLDIETKIGKSLRWNDEDILKSRRRKTGKDFRIKLISNYDLQTIPDCEEAVIQQWSDDMLKFILSISHYIR